MVSAINSVNSPYSGYSTINSRSKDIAFQGDFTRNLGRLCVNTTVEGVKAGVIGVVVDVMSRKLFGHSADVSLAMGIGAAVGSCLRGAVEKLRARAKIKSTLRELCPHLDPKTIEEHAINCTR